MNWLGTDDKTLIELTTIESKFVTSKFIDFVKERRKFVTGATIRGI